MGKTRFAMEMAEYAPLASWNIMVLTYFTNPESGNMPNPLMAYP